MSVSLEEPSQQQRQYWGKYRGIVVDNVDPLAMGRLLIEVPQVPAVAGNWAMPCVPYAGFQVGFFPMPESGASVWVEFEGGNPSFPIWAGCFWAEGHAPLPFAEDPLCKVFKTRSNMLLLDDTPGVGGVTMTSSPPAVDDVITLKFSAEGVLLTAPPAVLNMSIEEGITLEFPPCVLSMSEEEFSSVIAIVSSVVMTEEATVITSPDVSIEAEAAVEVNAAAGIDLGAGGAIAMEAGAGIDLTAGGGIAQEAGIGIDLTAGTGIALEAVGGIDLAAGAAIGLEAVGIIALESVSMDVTAAVALWTGDLNVLGIITMDTMPVMVVPI
jgi:hypothetical protein